jgi:hypothetical protein
MDSQSGKSKGLWRRLYASVVAYAHSPDPLQRSCNTIALLVASNQPFYPFYIRYLVGNDGGVSFLNLLSTPLFIAIPAIARRSPGMGLAALPVIGLANAMVATVAFGREAGIELFAIPCILIAAATTLREPRLVPVLSTMALVIYLAVFAAIQNPLHGFSPSEIARFYRLNMFSVAGLTAYIAYSIGSALRAAPDSEPKQR